MQLKKKKSISRKVANFGFQMIKNSNGKTNSLRQVYKIQSFSEQFSPVILKVKANTRFKKKKKNPERLASEEEEEEGEAVGDYWIQLDLVMIFIVGDGDDDEQEDFYPRMLSLSSFLSLSLSLQLIPISSSFFFFFYSCKFLEVDNNTAPPFSFFLRLLPFFFFK